MSLEIPLKCSCGKVTGSVKPEPAGIRLACYCRSCQAFARFLGREGDMLDDLGGTDIYQLAPSQVLIAQGADELRCAHFSKRGPLRWYTACCKTPVANTLSSTAVPFIGLQALFTDHDTAGHSREEAFGPIRHRLHARFAKGHVPGGHPGGPPSLLAGTVLRLLGYKLRGRGRPAALFDAQSGKPISPPEVLNAEQLAAIGLD